MIAQGTFTPRIITRNPSTKGVAELCSQGVEVKSADLDNAGTLVPALQGADGGFGNTFFWAHFSPAKEALHRANMAWAAREAGVGHFVISTLPDTRQWLTRDGNQWVTPAGNRMPVLAGYAVPHFDEKGATDHVFTDLGLNVTFARVPFCWGNALAFGMGPQPVSDGTYVLRFPLGQEPMAGIAIGGVGKCIHGLFENPDEFVGKTVGFAAGFLTGEEMAQIYTEVLGVTVKYIAVDPNDYRALGFAGAEDLGNMFQVYADCRKEFEVIQSVDLTRRLNPTALDFRGWVTKYKTELLKSMGVLA